MNIRYFDNAATTKINKEVLEEMLPFLINEYGNPSSIYSLGREAKRAIGEARRRVAELINCKPQEIYFTSGGSESDNTAIKGIAYKYKNKGKHIITSKIEHPAVLNTCEELEKQINLIDKAEKFEKEKQSILQEKATLEQKCIKLEENYNKQTHTIENKYNIQIKELQNNFNKKYDSLLKRNIHLNKIIDKLEETFEKFIN